MTRSSHCCARPSLDRAAGFGLGLQKSPLTHPTDEWPSRGGPCGYLSRNRSAAVDRGLGHHPRCALPRGGSAWPRRRAGTAQRLGRRHPQAGRRGLGSILLGSEGIPVAVTACVPRSGRPGSAPALRFSWRGLATRIEACRLAWLVVRIVMRHRSHRRPIRFAEPSVV